MKTRRFCTGESPTNRVDSQVFELFERFFHRLVATFTGITRREEQNVRRVRQNLFPTNAFRHDARFLKLVDAARDGFDFGKPVSAATSGLMPSSDMTFGRSSAAVTTRATVRRRD